MMHAVGLISENVNTPTRTNVENKYGMERTHFMQTQKLHLPQTISLPSGHGIGSVLTTREKTHQQNQKQ